MYDAQADSQQNQVYAAEELVFEGREFDSLNDLREYVAEVVNTDWVRNRGWNFKRWEVRNSCGTWAWCRVDKGVCTLIFPRGTRKQLTVMHELAHALTFDGHGPEFCAMYLRCVRRFMGATEADSLRCEFVEHKVKHRPRKPQWTTALDSIECDFFGG